MADQKFNINPHFKASEKTFKSVEYYVSGIENRDRFILSEVITFVESTERDQKKLGQEVLNLVNSKKQGIRVAITGSPGAGKSTFIEAFGSFLADNNYNIAVLAIDPSSHENHGSILGDKVRMDRLSVHPNVYIRPSSAGAVLGGVAKGTKDAIALCEAAGYDFVFVETVGVGQSEFLASNLTDITLCLLQPGAGDDIQGIKRGLLEMADLLLITKTDGRLYDLAQKSKQSYMSTVQLFPQKIIGRNRLVINVSSADKLGFDEVYKEIIEHINYLRESGIFIAQRHKQEADWFHILLKDELYLWLMQHQDLAKKSLELKQNIIEDKISAQLGLKQFIDYLDSLLKK
jgi:LAO/AO transport system kinase